MTIHEDIIAAYESLILPDHEDKKVFITDRGWYSNSGDAKTSDFEMLDSIEWDDESYQFNMTGVFHHKPTGALFYATDSGCSCPSPFEDMTVDRLKPLARMQDWLDHVEECSGDLKRDEEDVRLGRLEDANYRPWHRLEGMQRRLGYITDQSFRIFNTISDHFETHTVSTDYFAVGAEFSVKNDDNIE